MDEWKLIKEKAKQIECPIHGFKKCENDYCKGWISGSLYERLQAFQEVQKIINIEKFMIHGLKENCPKYCNLCILNERLTKLIEESQ